jgi:hypothetical protein
MITMEIDDETEDNHANPVFDARQQYYKLWLYCSGMVKQAAMAGDSSAWLRSLQLMFNHIYALLNDTEQKAIDKQLKEAVAAELVANTFNRRDPGFQRAHIKKVQDLTSLLIQIERDIYVAMNNHNMLLPRQVSDDDFTEDELDEESG